MSLVITLMAAGAVALNIALFAAVVMLCKAPWRASLKSIIATYGRLAVFVLSFSAVVGSLWMQYFANLAPCEFCWWQRIFMYPIFVISGIAVIKNTNFSEFADYVLALGVLGTGIALYQHLLQVLPQGSLIPCSASNECAVRSVFEFGYVTLPWIALSMFAVFVLMALLGRKPVSA